MLPLADVACCIGLEISDNVVMKRPFLLAVVNCSIDEIRFARSFFIRPRSSLDRMYAMTRLENDSSRRAE